MRIILQHLMSSRHLLAAACLLTALTMLPSQAWAKTYHISINQFVEHPSLNQSAQGFKDELKERGIDVQYSEHNSQGNMAVVMQSVSQILGEQPDLILAVATPSAQASAQKIKDIPILFTSVTDPVGAGLVKTMAKPGGNVSGTSDMNPVPQQLALIKEIQPNAARLGIMYNPGEPNSVRQVEMIRTEAQKLGLHLEEAVAVDAAAVYQAAKSLVGKVDAIYLPTDNTIISNLESILKVSLENKLPVYPGESDSVKRGGLASFSISYYKLGRQTGAMAAKILTEGASPADLAVETDSAPSLIINLDNARPERMNVPIPKAVLDKAEEILK